MSKLIILKGIPGSGKTTWAKEYCKDHSKTIRVNRDDLREMFSQKWSKGFENNIVKKAEIDLSKNALENGYDVILDDTNFSSTDITDEIKKVKDIEVEEKFFDTDVETCISRDASRSRTVGAAVIRRFYKNYVKTREENSVGTKVVSGEGEKA